MKFYDDTKPLYIKTDAYGVGLGATLLQTRSNTTCLKEWKLQKTAYSELLYLSAKAWLEQKNRYSNIEREALGILYGLRKFYHYCFVREVSIIMDPKPLVTIFKKDVATLSQRLQWIMLRINLYKVGITYKPRPDLFITNILPIHTNHSENKENEMMGMQLGINAIHTTTNISESMIIHELQQVTCQGQHMKCLREYIIQG